MKAMVITMFWKAKGGRVNIGDTDMDYISFGCGNDILVMIPGLGDGLTTVRGMAVTMAIMHRVYVKDYKVYIFSRKNHLQEGYSTRDMANDQAKAMEILGITKAKVLGVSQGGMIAQYLAIDYPNLVDKLVLAVTLSKQNDIVQAAVHDWINMAEQGNYKGLMIGIAEKSYSQDYLKRYRRLYPVLGTVGKPKDFSRFLIQADSCIQHETYPELNNITCPTLIIGGGDDKIVGVTAAVEMADKIKGSELFIYKDLGHALYEEAKDFHNRIFQYFSKT